MSADQQPGAPTRRRPSTRAVAIGVAVVALVLAGVVSFYAASTPDGLTKVSVDQGFADTEKDHAAGGGPLAGYDASFMGSDRAGVGVAGVVGVVVVLGLAGGLTLALRRRGDDGSEATASVSTAADDQSAV